MLRGLQGPDVDAVVDLAVTAGLFPLEEVGIVRELLEAYLDGAAEEGHLCLVDTDARRGLRGGVCRASAGR